MTQAVGVPSEFVEYRKADPSWKVMEGMAYTFIYDGMIIGNTQSGQSLPIDRWDFRLPTCVMAGENSKIFFLDAANR